MQHFRGSVIILCTKVKARDIFQQQCRSSSSSRSTKVLHRPIQATLLSLLCQSFDGLGGERNCWQTSERWGPGPYNIYSFFYYLGNYVDNTAPASTISYCYSPREPKHLLYFVYTTYKPYCTYCAQK